MRVFSSNKNLRVCRFLYPEKKLEIKQFIPLWLIRGQYGSEGYNLGWACIPEV